jgi:tetratricopeptide (TPR) repeat protein
MREQLELRLHPAEGGRSGAFEVRKETDRAPRHHSLQAAFQWSYDLLEPDAQRLLRSLSVFRGGFLADAAGAIADATPALLARLHSHSLLTGRPTADGGAIRFALLESLREFADALLTPEERFRLMDRHFACYLQRAEEMKPLYGTAETARALDCIEPETNNIRAALDLALSPTSAPVSEQVPSGMSALRLAAAMQWPWRLRGPLTEGRRYLTAILARPDAQEDTEARADALNALGSIALTQRDLEEARLRLTESLDLCRLLRYIPGSIAALSNLATTLMDGGDFDAARPLFEEALTLIRPTGHRGREAVVLNNLGNLAHWQRDLTAAEEYHTAALTIRREVSDTRGISLSQVGLGILAMERGDFPTAHTRLCEGLRLQHDLGDRSQIDSTLENIARAEEGSGNLERGITLRAAASAVRERFGIVSHPLRQENLDRERADLQTRLPTATFTHAWDRGTNLSLDDAVRFALGIRQ